MSTDRSPPDIVKRLKRAGGHPRGGPRGGVDGIEAGRSWSGAG